MFIVDETACLTIRNGTLKSIPDFCRSAGQDCIFSLQHLRINNSIGISSRRYKAKTSANW